MDSNAAVEGAINGAPTSPQHPVGCRDGDDPIRVALLRDGDNPIRVALLRDGDDPIRVAFLVGRGAIHRARGIANGMDCKMARWRVVNWGRHIWAP